MANTYNICNKLQAIADAITQGGGGGGGTTVIANPSGTPTADLNTVQIGQVIYDIPGGGGSSSYTLTSLYTGSGSSLQNTIQLSDRWHNYDGLYFQVGFAGETANFGSLTLLETLEQSVGKSVGILSFASAYVGLNTLSNDGVNLSFYGQNTNAVNAVYGVKFGSGGGGGSYSADDVSYDNTQSGLTATNVQDAIDENASDISTLNRNLTWQKVGEFTTNGNVAVTSLANCNEIMFVFVLTKPRVTLVTLPLDVFKVTGILADYMLYTTRCNFTAEYVNDTTISISSISSLANGAVYIYAR